MNVLILTRDGWQPAEQPKLFWGGQEKEVILLDLFINADKLIALREQKKELENLVKDINEKIKETEAALIEGMLSEEMQNFTRNNRQFVLTSRTYANARSGVMPSICEWMKKNDLGDMVKESVHSQTLQAWVKEYIEEEGELPEDLSELINVYEKSGITIRKK